MGARAYRLTPAAPPLAAERTCKLEVCGAELRPQPDLILAVRPRCREPFFGARRRTPTWRHWRTRGPCGSATLGLALGLAPTELEEPKQASPAKVGDGVVLGQGASVGVQDTVTSLAACTKVVAGATGPSRAGGRSKLWVWTGWGRATVGPCLPGLPPTSS